MNSRKQSFPKTPTLSQTPPTTSVLPKSAQIQTPATFSRIQLPLPAPPATTSTAPPRTTPAAKCGVQKKRPTGPSSSKSVPAGKCQQQKSPKAVSELHSVATAPTVPVDSSSGVTDLVKGIAEILGDSRLKRRRLLQRQRSRESKKRKMTALARNDKQHEFELESDERYSVEFELPPKVEVHTREQREYDLAYTDHVLKTQYTESWPTSSDTDSDGMSPPFVTQTSKTVSTSRKAVPSTIPPRKEHTLPIIEPVAPSAAPQPEESRTPAIEPVAPSAPVPPKVDDYTGMGQPGSSHYSHGAPQYGYLPGQQPDPFWDYTSMGQQETPIYEAHNPWQGTRGWEQVAESNMTEQQMRERNLSFIPYLNEAAAGGPDDPEFFRSWPGHVSYFIYQGKERKSLDFSKRVTATKGWKVDAGSPFDLAAKRAGLAHIPSLMYEKLNESLLTAFIERWNPETNSFHLPCAEMSIALHEVRAELGIRMRGNSMGLTMNEYVVGHKTMMGKKFKEAGEALGIPHDRGGCDWNKLMDKARAGVGMDQATQGSAYVLHILGTCLFPDKSGDKISYGHWDYVKDWNDMGEYSWGSGVLAHMFRQLGKATRWDCRKVSLCFTLLQSWIYAHFPRFRPEEDLEWNGEIPFCRRWLPEAQRTTRRNYRKELDKLTDVDIDWMSYGRWIAFEDPQLAPSTFEGIISFGDISEPYIPSRFKRQFGRVQTISGPVISPTRAHRGPKVKTYMVQHPLNQWAWSSVATHQWRLWDFGLPVEDGTETVPGYVKWFLIHTHPFINPPRVDEYKNTINRALAKLGPYEYAQPDMFFDMRGALADAVQEMRPYGMPSGYYHSQDHD